MCSDTIFSELILIIIKTKDNTCTKYHRNCHKRLVSRRKFSFGGIRIFVFTFGYIFGSQSFTRSSIVVGKKSDDKPYLFLVPAYHY